MHTAALPELEPWHRHTEEEHMEKTGPREDRGHSYCPVTPQFQTSSLNNPKTAFSPIVFVFHFLVLVSVFMTLG